MFFQPLFEIVCRLLNHLNWPENEVFHYRPFPFWHIIPDWIVREKRIRLHHSFAQFENPGVIPKSESPEFESARLSRGFVHRAFAA